MMTSTKVSIWSFAIWLLVSLFVSAIAPSEAEFMSGGFDQARSTVGTLSFFQNIAGLAFWVGVISLIVTAYKKIMSKHTPTITNVSGHNISAGDGATIATDNANVDQSVNINDSNLSLNSEHKNAIRELVEHVKNSGLPEVSRNHAKLLSESINSEIENDSPDQNKIHGYIKDIIDLAEAAKPTAEIVINGIKLLKSII